jgi:hypothetical protein
MFADDNTLSASGKSTNEISKMLQLDLSSANTWCKNNMMVLNLQKTKCMLMTTKRKHSQLKREGKSLNITIDNQLIKSVEVEKLLGVNIANTLSWEAHIKSIKQKVSCKLHVLKSIKKYLPLPLRKLYYQYYIVPNFEYCSNVWANGSKANATVLSQLQKRAARLILDKDQQTSSKPLFQQLGWQTIQQRQTYHSAILAYKAIHNLLPQPISTMFTLCKNTTDHNLRSTQSNNIYLPKKHMNSPILNATKSWNSLPTSLKHSPSLPRFKKCLKRGLN